MKEEDKILQKYEQRNPNIALVRKFVDEAANQFKPAPGLRIVKTKFFKRDPQPKSWFAAVPAKNLASIVRQLQRLHSQGYVHGDIRVYNLLLHRGCFSDFDLTRQAGEPYPSNLDLLAMDGRRAREVEIAIAKNKVGELAMQKSHDLESMHFVLSLFQPVEEKQRDVWMENVTNRPAEKLFDFMDFLENFEGKVELTNETELGKECVLCATSHMDTMPPSGLGKKSKKKKKAAAPAKPLTTMELLADIGEPDASVEWAV
uniref:Uncharacterized protein n=1 Tax=Grammatophora oceanica TaxID=210454 RepID=A0A7S1UWJ9_9STRA